MNIYNLNSFLLLGYFVEYRNDEYKLDLSKINKSKYINYPLDELIDSGKQQFISCISNRYDSSRQNVIPLSGGLDSRAILGALLECTGSKNLYTYTYGVPGTYDYDIGNHIAKIIGTNHISLDLTKYKYSVQELIDVAKRTDYQTVLFHHPPLWELDSKFKDGVIWSGYIGDAIVGGHLKKIPSSSLNEAKIKYLNNRALVRNIHMINCTKKDISDLFTCDCINDKILSIDEQLLFQEGCQKFTAPNLLIKGYQYETPFINNSWMDFCLSIDNKYRYNQGLYQYMLIKAFPNLFSIGTKNNHGLPITTNKSRIYFKGFLKRIKKNINKIHSIFKNPYMNYMDFGEAIRLRHDFYNIVYNNIMDLDRRNIIDWIDLKSLLKNHLNGQYDFGNALVILTSLELIFKAKNIR